MTDSLSATTNKVILSYVLNIFKLVEPHSATVTKHIEQYTGIRTELVEENSATVSKVNQQNSATGIRVIEPHPATGSKVVEPCFSIVSNDCLSLPLQSLFFFSVPFDNHISRRRNIKFSYFTLRHNMERDMYIAVCSETTD